MSCDISQLIYAACCAYLGLPYEVWQFINDLDQPHRKKAILKDIPLRSVDSKIHGQLAIKVIWDYPKIHVRV